MNRGDRGGKVFKDELDYGLFLKATEEDLQELPKGHAQKCALADLAHSRTTVSHKWLAQGLCMGHPQNLSLYVRQSRMADAPPLLSPANRR